MVANKIELKTVNELLDMKFFIPSYQRGYRWTEQQVKDLLNDVNEFNPERIKDSDEETWYCLQPLVVKKMEKTDSRLENENERDNWYEVIDGQQRLTTIFIIVNLIGDDSSLSLQYQTRPKSTEFLRNIRNSNDDSNIDFHFMLEAKNSVLDWKGDKPSLLKKLTNSCKFIWYETEDDAYDVFKRLNSGKISLSNAELVKALLMKKDNFIGLDKDALQLKQYEMAGEWDRIEQILHNDSFWYFINPEPEDARFNCTRMDFILELILRCKKKDGSDYYEYDVDSETVRNNYFIFSTLSRLINESDWSEQWKQIQRYFRIIKSWYDDRSKYHYIGYLMNLKGEDKKSTLRLLLSKSDMAKDKFNDFIKERCRETIIKNNKKEVDLSKYEYGKHSSEIHNVLLLFNLATTQNQISEMSRYPFDKHYEAAKKKWSLEHIHAQNEKMVTWNKETFKKIKLYLSLIEIIDNGTDQLKDLKDFLKNKETSDDINEETHKAIIGAFMGKKVVKKEINGDISFSSDFEKDDHLTNMALLQGDKNAAFNNKTYPEKKEKLAEYENVESESLFVPVCTRNVFFKHYSPNSSNPFMWDERAGLEYVTAMLKVIASYLDLQVVLPQEKKDEKYGLKIKEEQK